MTPSPFPRTVCFVAAAMTAIALSGCTSAPDLDAQVAEPRAFITNGMMIYMADAAVFTPCRGGDRVPIAMEGGYLGLERAYSATIAAEGLAGGTPLMASVVASVEERPPMEGEGTRAHLVVERALGVWPDETCEANRADAPLEDTYWRIVAMRGEEVEPVGDAREPHMALSDGRASLTAGCNIFNGGVTLRETLQGDGGGVAGTLSFGQMAATRMACPGPLDALERRLQGILPEVAQFEIAGNVMELRDAAGAPLALLQAAERP